MLIRSCKEIILSWSYAIFGKISRTASEVILELIRSKCIHVLLYGLEACQSTAALVRLCCKPSVYEVIWNEQYRNHEMLSVLHCVSKKTSPMFLAITRESIVGFHNI